MPTSVYLKISDIDGESYADLEQNNTLNLDAGELSLLNALVEAGFTFGASLFNFERASLKWSDGTDPWDTEYTGPEITPLDPVGKFDPFAEQSGAVDHLAFLKFDGLNDEEEAELVRLVESNFGDDFHLITAGDKTFLKLTIDPDTPNDHFPTGPALTDLSDDLFG